MRNAWRLIWAMNFEITLPERSAQYFLNAAGLDTSNYYNLWEKAVLFKKAKLPAEVSCRYFFADDRLDVRVTVWAYRPATQLKIEYWMTMVSGNRSNRF